MAQEQTAPGPTPPMQALPEQSSPRDALTVDGFLESLIWAVDLAEGSMSYGLTLSVGGSLISGTLIAKKVYFDGFAKEFSDALPDSIGAEARERMRRELAEGGNDSTDSPPRYVHLRGIQFFPDGRPIPDGPRTLAGFGRIRLDRVDAFILGSIGGTALKPKGGRAL